MLEIDKNALIYICELLGIEPVEGKLLGSIIHKLEGVSGEIIIGDGSGGDDEDKDKRKVEL